MTEKKALEILCTGDDLYGSINDATICVGQADIISNLEMNDYSLDLEMTQDLASIKKGVWEMYQGHSLSEVEIKR